MTEVTPRDPKALVVFKSIEQRTLEVLERIEKILLARWEDDAGPALDADGNALDVVSIIHKIEPTKTPFSEKLGKKRKAK